MSTPVPNSTRSFWRSRLHDLDTHRTTSDLPAEADVVIIGAGYSGAAIAHHILEKGKNSLAQRPLSIVILEAREACSGATGRNGGHLKPDLFHRAANVLQTHGKEHAEEVATFEARQVNEIKNLVKQEQIDCDFVITRAYDVCLYDEADHESKQKLNMIGEAGISTAPGVFYTRGATAEGISGVKGTKSCFTHTTAHLWPYKLVLHLLSKVVSCGVNLQTHTPTQSIIASPDEASRPWTIHTPRGPILTTTVVLATNAYTASLVPSYHDKIIPVRGMCVRIIPDPSVPDPPHLSNSYILRHSPLDYDYLIPRPDGSIILGGGRCDYFHDPKLWYHVSDDSALIEPAREYFDGYMQRHFRGWERRAAEVDRIWTGIMGFSSDGFPHVGPVPDHAGMFVCAGFSGHGMPQIFLAAKALAGMVLSGRDADDEVDLPRLYRTSRERLASTQNVVMEEWEKLYKKTTGAEL